MMAVARSDRVVITFVDITEIKKLEGKEKLVAELVIANAYLEKLTSESKRADL